MRQLFLVGLIALSSLIAAPTRAADLTLEQIMADPSWIGPPVESPYFSVDGRAVYYHLKRADNEIRDLYRVDLANGSTQKLDADAESQASGPPVFDRAHHFAAFARHGDIFLRRLGSGQTVQVTRSPRKESAPRFSADGRLLTFRSGPDWFRYAIQGGVATPAAVIKPSKDPQEEKPDAMERRQLGYFKTLREARASEEAQRKRDRSLDSADTTRMGEPFYLGDKVKIVDTELSPNGRWMVVITRPKAYKAGKDGKVIHYVTRSGYSKVQKARTKVGRNDPAPYSLLLLDLENHKQYTLGIGDLPGIHDDPLADLRKQQIAALKKAGHDDEAKALKAPKTRPVEVWPGSPQDSPVAWNDAGTQALIELRAVDNKDRWLASIDFDKHKLVSQNRLTDPAWINWNFNDFGWLADGRTLWYLSEASGYSQLYTKPLDGSARQLTSGTFEVSHPQLSPDGKWFYVRANQVAPYSYDIYRVPSGGGELARLTRLKATESFELSPDGSKLLVLHSHPYVPSQLALVAADGSGQARELTDTRTDAYKAMHWIAPKIVKVSSTHGAGSIYAKYYQPADYDTGIRHPAVIFVHGAGYTQNVYLSFPYYFREQMFHNLLAQRGYAVLDMDYRASEGYGREWRTAIYRDMGHPELEDLLDGKAWLVAHHSVDPERVGIYGGSYGGFMTLMALLRAPGEFAAGAAVRPVSDWSQYNHEYTANILNDPQLDPEAYARSSPIEFADSLADPLLICHGLIDDNVLTEDSIRLYQRFIELHKKNFWMSLYPMDRHAFENADSWYDEYRRIDDLFKANLERK